MDDLLYNIIFSEQEKTIRFHNDELGPMNCNREKGESLVAQVEGSENARHVSILIGTIRPDLKIIEEDIEGEY